MGSFRRLSGADAGRTTADSIRCRTNGNAKSPRCGDRADVNNGAYLQFLGNWGRESYVYASQALKKIGARRMAQIVDDCQALIDERLEHRGERLHRAT